MITLRVTTMKRIFYLWFFSIMPCLAGGLASLSSLTSQYGPSTGNRIQVGADPATGAFLYASTYRSNGLDITVTTEGPGNTVYKVMISRDSAFSSMEIPDILKPLSPDEDWTQKDDNTWVLTQGKATARWDGEGRISILSN
jgi:hypothetical protein